MKKKEVEEKYKEIADAIRSHTDALCRHFAELNLAVREQTDILMELANALDPSRLQPSIEEPEVEVADDPFIVTQGDKVLCRACFKREFFEPHPSTWSCLSLKYGVCSSCDLKIKHPKTMDDWKREVSEVERDLNTGKEKTDA